MLKTEMSHINKSFFGVQVLYDVSIRVEKQSIHALIGENGAGKSTLMNILGGVLPPDSGSIKIDGIETNNMTVKKAEMHGIAFVHQEISLFNDLLAYENIFMTNEITRGRIFINRRKMIEESNALFKELGIDIKATDLVKDMSTAKKQLLGICRSLFTKADLFILDEPTTALSNDEIRNFFRIIKKLQKAGKTFIFISHKLPEIFQICDTYTVLRNGRLVRTGKIKDTTPEEVTREIVGPNSHPVSYSTRKLGPVILEIRNLSGNGFRNINLNVRKGEIVGFTGLQGAGSSEVMQTVFGLIKSETGKVIVSGIDITNRSTKTIMRAGIGMVPANRKENSIFESLDILDNYSLANITVSRNPLFIRGKEEHGYRKYEKEINLKANSPKDPVVSLSGGNQQKIIISRWLSTNADILLLDNPTQGIDVGAKTEVYRLLLELAEKGKTIIFNTLELAEIQKCADCCVVFYHGQVAKILRHDEMEDQKVMLYATGVKKAEEEENHD